MSAKKSSYAYVSSMLPSSMLLLGVSVRLCARFARTSLGGWPYKRINDWLQPQGPITLLSGFVVDTVRVEGDMILDLCHRFKWGLISPHRIERELPASRNAVVGSVALVRAIRRVFATRERCHIDIPTRDILDGRIGCLTKRQRIVGVGDNLSADCDDLAGWVRIDRDGVVGARSLNRLVSH